MLKEYDMKRDSVELNRKAHLWSHYAVWNCKYMEPKVGYTLQKLWEDSEVALGGNHLNPMKLKTAIFAVQ